MAGRIASAVEIHAEPRKYGFAQRPQMLLPVIWRIARFGMRKIRSHFLNVPQGGHDVDKAHSS